MKRAADALPFLWALLCVDLNGALSTLQENKPSPSHVQDFIVAAASGNPAALAAVESWAKQQDAFGGDAAYEMVGGKHNISESRGGGGGDFGSGGSGGGGSGSGDGDTTAEQARYTPVNNGSYEYGVHQGWETWHGDRLVRPKMCSGRGAIFLYFLHMPKASGTSFACTTMPDQTRKKKVLPACATIGLSDTARYMHTAQRHWPYSEFREHYGCKPPYFVGKSCKNHPQVPKEKQGQAANGAACYPIGTILRDPVQRYVSSFYYSWGHNRHDAPNCGFMYCKSPAVERRYNAGDLSLDEFTSDPDPAVCFSCNLMVKLLGSEGLVKEKAQKQKAYADVAVRNDTAGREMLMRAKARLVRLDFFGLSEAFELSFLAMQRTLGISYTGTCQCNVDIMRNNRPLLSEPLTRRIREQNSLDGELYEFARHVFYGRMAHLGLKALDAEQACSPDNGKCKADSGDFVPMTKMTERAHATFENMEKSKKKAPVTPPKYKCHYPCTQKQL